MGNPAVPWPGSSRSQRQERGKEMAGHRKKGLKVYSVVKRKAEPEEIQRFQEQVKKEREKYERDLKCGGVSEDGTHYIRLHDRWEEPGKR